MNEKEFNHLIKKDKYQVFLFYCMVPIPLNLGVHYWFVTNKKGKINRWEVMWRPNQCKTSWKYLHKNGTTPVRPFNLFLFIRNPRTRTHLAWKTSGKKGSLAERIVRLIESSPKKYPYYNRYSLFGPNSNTYAQWVINKFSELKLKLSWRAIGKNYNPKKS